MSTTSDDPQAVYNAYVADQNIWAANKNAAAVADYHTKWPGYVQNVQIAQSRGGANMPAPFLPALITYVDVAQEGFQKFMANEPFLTVVYGRNSTDYVCTPNTLPTTPVQSGGVGNQIADAPGWWQALPGDTTPNGSVIYATSEDGVSGLFKKFEALFGSGVFQKVG